MELSVRHDYDKQELVYCLRLTMKDMAGDPLVSEGEMGYEIPDTLMGLWITCRRIVDRSRSNA